MYDVIDMLHARACCAL